MGVDYGWADSYRYRPDRAGIGAWWDRLKPGGHPPAHMVPLESLPARIWRRLADITVPASGSHLAIRPPARRSQRPW